MLTSSSSRPTRSSTTRPASAPGSPHGYRQQTMEPLWSPVGATGGNQRQIARANEPEKQAKTLAVGCDRLPRGVHGKEGVDGSSPSEGFTKGQQMAFFVASIAYAHRSRVPQPVPKICPQARERIEVLA